MSKEGMMRKIALTLVFCFIASIVLAGGVIDDNNNNLGDILVGTGINHGESSIGTWTDSNFLKGTDGQDGYTPVKGADYFDGKDGIDGKNGYTPIKGIDYTDGQQGKQGIQGEIGKGLKDQYKAGVEVRLVDTKHTTWLAYYNRDFNNANSEVGIKLVVKLGKSYEEKLIEGLKK